FARLIAASANTDYKDGAIPSFVEVIKQLSSFDASILKELKDIFNSKEPVVAGKLRLISMENGMGTTVIEHYIPLQGFNAENSASFSVSIDNLQRLGLIIVQHGYTAEKQYHDDLL